MEEKPLDCSLCKRKSNIVYKKIKDGEIHSCQMCSVCPVLQANIGIPAGDETTYLTNLNLDKKCPHCHTSLHEITIEGSVGCSICYQIFEDFLLSELSRTDAIPLKSDSEIMKKKSIPIHLGKTPELLKNEDTTKKLESLQSALDEAIASESFERAAHLRDQIKTFMEKRYGKERKTS